MLKPPPMKLVAVVGVGPRRGRRLTCAALAGAAALSGARVAVAPTHDATRGIVSRETSVPEADVLFGVVDRVGMGASEVLAAAKRVVVATWGGIDVERQIDDVLARLSDEHGFPQSAVSLVFHEPKLNAKMVESLARIDRSGLAGRVYCVGAFSREYHETAGAGLPRDVMLGEEPAMAMFAELWMELRL